MSVKIDDIEVSYQTVDAKKLTVDFKPVFIKDQGGPNLLNKIGEISFIYE